MNDEEIFQAARNYVIALLQKISMEDFLPILLGAEYPRIVKNTRDIWLISTQIYLYNFQQPPIELATASS